MSFKFNFSDTADQPGPDAKDSGAVEVRKENSEIITISKEVPVRWEEMMSDFRDTTGFHMMNGTALLYKSFSEVLNAVSIDEKTPVSDALSAQTDLVPNVYEGGLKIWECSFDLTQYLASSGINFSSLKVLELGCGAGLPGIFSLTQGAIVDFQDYNDEVIQSVTIPNVGANVRQSTVWPPKCRFFAGDWASLSRVVNSGSKPIEYDVILTSETVYSRQSYGKLHDVMEELLALRGVVYLAAKICYFGIGGGSQDFANFVEGRGVFSVRTVKQFTEGVRREILELVRLR